MDKVELSKQMEMVTDERKWPLWPFLPLKRDFEVGVLASGRGAVVFKANLFTMTVAKLQDCEKFFYAETEDIILDGWVVD